MLKIFYRKEHKMKTIKFRAKSEEGDKNMKQFSLEEYLKNPSRKVVTREGNPVKILCTNYNSTYYPIIAEIYYNNCGTTKSNGFTKNGEKISNIETTDDLFFKTEKHEGWINVYKGLIKFRGAFIYPSKEEALEKGKELDSYITTTKIEWED